MKIILDQAISQANDQWASKNSYLFAQKDIFT